jgi:imidazolonepropionase-like amidohydrolase
VIVDCSGRTVLPGLFDCHVHLMVSSLDTLALLNTPFSLQFFEAARNMAATLATGITTVRDAAGADLGVRRAQETGLTAGPRIRISVNMISQTGGHGDDWYPGGIDVPLFVPHPGRPGSIVDGPDEARKKTRELIRAGADVIKIATSGGVLSPRDDPRHAHLRDAEIAAIVEEATAAGISVMSHAAATDGIKAAVRNGVRSIEHGDFLDDQAIEMMLKAGTWLVPTLIATHGIVQATEAGVAIADNIVDKARMLADAHRQSVTRAVAAGVRIAMGTDSGVTPHGDNLGELSLMRQCGMTPLAVLKAATSSAAELMGLDHELGALQPGKRSDLVIADGEQLDLDTLRDRIRLVYQDGRLVHHKEA